MNIAVLVSGNGTNLKALIDAEKAGELGSGRITLVVSDKAGAPALKKAEAAGIKIFLLEAKGFETRETYDARLSEELSKEKIDIVVLAGFMRILGPLFVRQREGRIINIHPALLPAFKGVQGIRDAYEYGVKVTGVTVHFVNAELDAGPIILQEAVSVDADETLETLEEKIHAVEHRLYPRAVRLLAEGRLKLDGRRVKIEKDRP
jgi:phosphoribosylglycinamide formyltransferase 1